VVSCAFDASQIEVTIIFGVYIFSTVCTLSDIPSVFRQFEFYLVLLYIFCIVYIFVIQGRFHAYKEHLERYLSSTLFNIPDICDRMSQFLNFGFDFLSVDGVVHIFNTTL
jgi:Ca2+/Na+ antiporter